MTRRSRRPRPAGHTAPLAPPADCRVSELVLGGRRLVVLSFPVHPSAMPSFALPLSEAEREVAWQVLAGLSNQEIAAQRGTSVRTVANQVASILRKVGVSSRRELAAAMSSRK